jgi:hypothetical protein
MATIRIPPVLRPAVGGEREINAAGENVGEILQAVVAEHPGTETQLFGADGLQDLADVLTGGIDLTFTTYGGSQHWRNTNRGHVAFQGSWVEARRQ